MVNKIMEADGYVTPQADPGAGGLVCIKHIKAYSKGATAGDVFVIREGGPVGNIVFYGVIKAANGEDGPGNLPEGGLPCKTPVYYSEQVAAAGKTRTQIII